MQHLKPIAEFKDMTIISHHFIFHYCFIEGKHKLFKKSPQVSLALNTGDNKG